MMICPKCGAEIPDNSEYCNICGVKLSDVKEPETNEAETDSEDSRSLLSKIKGSVPNISYDKKKWAIAGGAVVALILIALFASNTICIHSWQPATCTSAERCSKCNKFRGKPLEHKPTKATCTEPSKCKLCGIELENALGHDVKQWETAKEATCTEGGEKTGECERCKETITEETQVLGHDLGEWETTVEPTCTVVGNKTAKCKRCGETVSESIPALGHQWSEWKTSKPASMSEEGEQVSTCNRCGEKQTQSIPIILKEEVEKRLQDKLSDVTAITAMELYGEREYPFGFDPHVALGEIACEPYDENTWFLKYEVTITNAFGAEYDTVVEARVSGSDDNPKIDYFYVY